MKYFVQFGGYSQSVYDCVDYYDDDISPWYNLRRLEEYVFIHADSIAFNSGVLRNRKLEKYPYIRNNSYVVPCGCNISLFHTKKKGKPKKAESELRIGMVGHINFRIDFDLLLLLARHKPEWRFFVIGPVMASRIEDQLYEVEKNVRQLKTYINVSFIGRRQKDTLPDLLTSFDVCIIPYRTSHGSVKFCNPMKAYEYFALGKPVVSTSIPALQELDHHIISFADDYVTFAAFIEKLSTQWSNTRTQIAERTAQEHSWENKVSAILRHLK